ncbi:MAG: hypothetical protein H6644_11715 [Caldilineaceae bacterium]|nr:hypothetical protein [Caldilineaceae bacterium]
MPPSAFSAILGYGLIRADAAVEGYSGESALAYAARQMEFGPRPITSDANAELEAWLIGELQAADWRAAVQPYVAQVPVSAVGSDVLSATVSADFYTVEGENIIAVKAPTDVEDPPVGLLVTHFDSRVVSDADPDPALRADLNPGANAGASGTARCWNWRAPWMWTAPAIDCAWSLSTARPTGGWTGGRPATASTTS